MREWIDAPLATSFVGRPDRKHLRRSCFDCEFMSFTFEVVKWSCCTVGQEKYIENVGDRRKKTAMKWKVIELRLWDYSLEIFLVCGVRNGYVTLNLSYVCKTVIITRSSIYSAILCRHLSRQVRRTDSSCISVHEDCSDKERGICQPISVKLMNQYLPPKC